MNIPYFVSDNKDINTAFRIAYADMVSNIQLYKNGLLEKEEPVFIAGMGYVTPWTRDAAINTWNCGGLLFPEIGKNTLLSVLTEDEWGLRIGGEYWDAIIWTIGAWQEYIYTGDKEFLKVAYEAVKNSLVYFEETEFDEGLNLFRGAACYGDGVAAYPDIYATPGESGIIEFANQCKEHLAEKGVGLPMHTLSTNCLYYEAYVTAVRMEKELGVKGDVDYELKAENMKNAINKHFWMEDKGNYRYIVDSFGGCDSMEGMGISFAILFGIADEDKCKKIMDSQYVAKAGIPCVYPSFARYDTEDGMGFGRHSGTVWPHVQAFWGDAAYKCGCTDKTEFEIDRLTEFALRDGHFAEIYHPETGVIYGGRQERWGVGIIDWDSEKKQMWSATGYIRMMILNVMGMNFAPNGITFAPAVISKINHITLTNLAYRDMNIDVEICGTGSKIKSFTVNSKEQEPFLPANLKGKVKIKIALQ